MNHKKFGLLYVLNLVMITALVLAACSKSLPECSAGTGTKSPGPGSASIRSELCHIQHPLRGRIPS